MYILTHTLYIPATGPSNDNNESSFNNLKWIHNKWRNSLGKEKIKKLLQVKFNGDIIERTEHLWKQTNCTDNIDYELGLNFEQFQQHSG